MAQVILWTVVLFVIYLGLAGTPIYYLIGLVVALVAIIYSFFVYGLLGAYQAYKGRDFRYWLLGDVLDRQHRRP